MGEPFKNIVIFLSCSKMLSISWIFQTDASLNCRLCEQKWVRVTFGDSAKIYDTATFFKVAC